MRPYDSKQHPFFFGATLVIVILNFIVFFHELKLGDQVEQYVEAYGFTPAKLNAEVTSTGSSAISGDSPSVWTTFITSMFLHSGWEHILSNMLFLVLLGPRVEGRMGSWAYLIFYFLAGIVGSLLIYVMNPTSSTPGIGASGAIAGVIGAALITDPTAYVWMPPQLFVPVWFFGPFWFLSEFWMAERAAQGDMVAHWVHVGGFCTGLITGFLIRRNHVTAIPASVAAGGLASPAAPTAAHAAPSYRAAVTQNVPPAAAVAATTAAVREPAHSGAPASPRPPVAPRSPQEAAVHVSTSRSIHKHKFVAAWIILAFAILVVITNLNRDVFAALGDGIFTFLVLLGLWTGGEHLLAHISAKMRAKAPQNA